jgi:hypothetical protein
MHTEAASDVELSVRARPHPFSAGPMNRVVALGASNLTRGFGTVVATARATWGPGVEVMAALGHGRSYGTSSSFLGRRLPGILESGLWRQLESASPAPMRALVTDVGNDIGYGFSAQQTLAWVDDTVRRLLRFTDDIVLTDLPLASLQRLSPSKFRAVRAVLFPSSRLSLDDVLKAAEDMNAGLGDLAAAHGVRFFRLNPSWYGVDPIHIRPSLWRAAWEEILGGGPSVGRHSQVEAWRLYFMRPERRWMFGVEQITPQAGTRLRGGGRIWLY